jgi:pilus assembly protein CpaF
VILTGHASGLFNAPQMFSIVITEKGGAQRQLDFQGAEIGIGRLEDNDLCLPKNNVSKYHARLVWRDERYVIVDQKSTNGTYVNGRRISAPMVVRKGDKIYIGDFILTLAAPGSVDAMAAREFRPPIEPSPELRSPTIPTTRVHDMGHAISDLPPANQVEPGSDPAPAEQVEPGATLPSDPPPPAAATALGEAPPRSSLPPPLPKLGDLPPPLRPDEARSAASGVSPPRSRSAAAWSGDGPLPSMVGGLTSPAVLAPSIRLQGALAMLMERLATHMNVARSEESAFPSEHQSTLDKLMDELAQEGAIGPDLDRRFLREAAMSEAVGLGPLDRLLANRAVREVVIDGPNRVLADLGGGLTSVSSFFSDDSAVLVAARRLLHRAGQKLDPDEPVHEAQLPAGGHLQLLLPPLAAKGALLAVRCPARAQSSPESMVTDGLLSIDMLALLRSRVQRRANILVLGPIGSGVSGVLTLLAALAPEHERVVTIEDSPSASLLNPQALPLARKAMPELPLSEFLTRAAQLRYDRLLIDDLRPEDALSALAAAAAGSGMLLGMHAPNPELALRLLELYAQSATPGAGLGLQPLLAAALQLVVQLGPDGSGSRRIQSICELQLEQDQLALRPLFRHDGKSFLELHSA